MSCKIKMAIRSLSRKSLCAAETDVDWAAFVGDEAPLGAAEALLSALPQHVRRAGALEVPEDSVGAVKRVDIPVDVLARSSRGAELLAWADTFPIPPGRGERGLPRSQLVIEPYWSVKGKAPRRVLERGEPR